MTNRVLSTDSDAGVLEPSALADPIRLEALARTGLLDSAPEESFDRFTRLAVRVLGVPTALVSLVDDHRQFFKSCVGLPEPYATTRETPLSHSFCQYTVTFRRPLVVRDAREDPLLASNLAIPDLGVIAYAGVPLVTADGQVLGSFCAIDSRPRDWTDADLATLTDLAEGVVTEIELREANAEALRLLDTVERDRVQMTAILDSTAEGIYGIDEQGRCTFLNAFAGRVLGYEMGEVIGRNMHALIHHTRGDGTPYPEDECPMYQAFTRRKGIRLSHEVLWRRDGSSFIAEYSSQPLFRDGSVIGAVVTFLDISDRHGAERRLGIQYAVASVVASSQDLDQALPRLLETIGAGLHWDVGLFWQVEGDALVCGPIWLAPTVIATDLVDASRHARIQQGHGLVGAAWERGEPVWVADLEHATELARTRVAEREGLAGALAFPIVSGGRTYGVVEFLSHKRRAPDDELLRTLATLGYQLGQFIARLEVEEGLRVANRAVASTSSGVSISDATQSDLPLIYVNPAFSAITGYQPEDVIGRNCRFLQGPDTDPAVVRRIREAIAAGRECAVELLNYHKDGSPFWNELTLSPVTDPAGVVTHFIGLQTDITARKESERELREARASAEAASRAKSQFLANMSHELRTPLNAVILYSELLQEEAEDRGVPEFVPDLEKIRGAGRHLLTLINGVLDLAKVESGKMELHRERFDVAGLIHEVVATVKPLVEKNRNTLDVALDPELGTIDGDATKVRQILFNLLSNAAKFTNAGRLGLDVVREHTADGESLVIRVRDTGIGVTPEQMVKLFQPFNQADEAITRQYGGTGLGLAICKDFAELMGGTIAASSEPGQGMEFTVRLPVEVATAEGRMAGGPGGPVDGSVLVIDADPVARADLVSVLAELGLPVVAVETGEQGLQSARECRPALVFLDVIMPDADGWEVLMALKADPALTDVPVVMLAMSPGVGQGYMLGAEDYLLKPVDQARLVALLDRLDLSRGAGRVLVVDDDAATRSVVRKLLSREGWTVEEAEHGQSALARVAEGGISLVVLDLIMPVMDGFEFLAALRAQPAWRALPVLVMTSKDLTLDDRRRLSGSVEAILRKGQHSRDEVLKEVQALAGRYTRGAAAAVFRVDSH